MVEIPIQVVSTFIFCSAEFSNALDITSCATGRLLVFEMMAVLYISNPLEELISFTVKASASILSLHRFCITYNLCLWT